MEPEPDDRTKHPLVGRTWLDIVIGAERPRLWLVVATVLLIALIIRAEFVPGVTHYGPLGPIGKANSEAERFECINRLLDGLPNQLNGWKNEVSKTAGTTDADELRETRLDVWYLKVDQTTDTINRVQDLATGVREEC